MLDDVLSLFGQMVQEGASDLILRAGHRPVMRVDGEIRFVTSKVLSEEESEALAEHILGAEQAAVFRDKQEKDTAFVVAGAGRFRANILRQRQRTAFVFRHVRETVPSMEDLHLPADVICRLATLKRGLVLVTGIAGSGKSTTLASMIDYMNVNTCRQVYGVEQLTAGSLIKTANSFFAIEKELLWC